MLRRGEESKFTNWYFEIDRRFLWCVIGLMLVGMLAQVSAGSVAAERMNPPQPWHFFLIKALPFYGAGLITLLVSSAMSSKWVIRISAINVIACFLLLLITLAAPHVVKGSARWVMIPGIGSVMPADLMKPGFIILTAWFLARMKKISGENIFTTRRVWRPDAWPAYLVPFALIFGIILSHPDFGTSVLYLIVFIAMLFVAGLPLWLLPILGGAGAVVGIGAFLTRAHIRARVLGFLGMGGPEAYDNYQIQQSLQSIQHGGLLGSAGDSFVKQYLPDAHTDFVFAAIAEDYGAIIACGLIGVLLYVMKRLAYNANRAHDKFVFYACSGAFVLFGAQVCINIASTLHIMPPKGMTLPFISYGGSSLISFCLLLGMIIAISREDRWK